MAVKFLLLILLQFCYHSTAILVLIQLTIYGYSMVYSTPIPLPLYSHSMAGDTSDILLPIVLPF